MSEKAPTQRNIESEIHRALDREGAIQHIRGDRFTGNMTEEFEGAIVDDPSNSSHEVWHKSKDHYKTSQYSDEHGSPFATGNIVGHESDYSATTGTEAGQYTTTTWSEWSQSEPESDVQGIDARVVREGYGEHVFSGKNKARAGHLIAKLAVKNMQKVEQKSSEKKAA